MQAIITWLTFNHIVNVFDVLVTATFIYAGILLLRKTRSIFIFRGIATFIIIYLLAAAFGLKLTTLLFQAFFSFFVVILVIIFQKELRRFFENFSISSLNPFSGTTTKTLGKEAIDIILESVTYMAKKKIGAIIVLPGKQNLERFLEGGFTVEGKISEPLILSIFDTATPGHDGAMIIENESVKKFGVHLPLAESFKKFGNIGTRHRASLGLSEVSDALIITVSEERGSISLSKNSEIKVVGADKLETEINKFMGDLGGDLNRGPISTLILSDTRDKIISLAISILLWITLAAK